jgi:hypothetical protein
MTHYFFHTHKRALEIQHALIFLVIGVVLALPHEIMYEGSQVFSAFEALMPEPAWAALFLFVGSLRIGAVIVNGRSPRGSPIARIFGASISLALFAFMIVAFAKAAPPGLWAASVYAVLALAEVRMVAIATVDLRNARHP